MMACSEQSREKTAERKTWREHSASDGGDFTSSGGEGKGVRSSIEAHEGMRA